jgi:hypothetical protein
MWGVTTREKVERLLDRLSEAELAAEYERLRAAVERGSDEWGDLSKVHEVAFGESMGRLAEDERAAGHDPW